MPLVVDADNGYGDEDSVVRTVYELERAGAAAMILEDQVFPKRCGHAAGKSVIPLDRYMRKLECALEARQTSLVVVARTDATTMDEGILRAKRFAAAGADVTLVDGLPSTEALERVGWEVPGHKDHQPHPRRQDAAAALGPAARHGLQESSFTRRPPCTRRRARCSTP